MKTRQIILTPRIYIPVSFDCAKMVESKIRVGLFSNWDVECRGADYSCETGVGLLIYRMMSNQLIMLIDDSMEEKLK